MPEPEEDEEPKIDASLLIELRQIELQLAELGSSLAATRKTLLHTMTPATQRALRRRIEEHAAMQARVERLRARLTLFQETERRIAAEEQFAALANKRPQ